MSLFYLLHLFLFHKMSFCIFFNNCLLWNFSWRKSGWSGKGIKMFRWRTIDWWMKCMISVDWHLSYIKFINSKKLIIIDKNLQWSSTHLVNGFFERITTNFVEYCAMNNFRSFENGLKYVSFKLKANISKYFIYLCLGPCKIKVCFSYPIRAKLFRK